MAYIVTSKHKPKVGYWLNDLRSLGIEPTRSCELNDQNELENLANNVKDSMFQDYKTAYGINGDQFKEEANSTISV